MTVLALISDPPVVAKILSHLGLPAAPPTIAPARSAGEGDHDGDLFIDVPFIDLDQPVGDVEDAGADDSWPGDPGDVLRDDDEAPP